MAHFFLKKIKPLADRCKKVYIYRSTVVNFAATFEPKIEANNFQFMDTRRRGRSVSFEPEKGVITFTASLISFFDLSSEFITSTLARALRLTSIHFQARNLTKKTLYKCLYHRHLREIDCSLAGRQLYTAMALIPGANQYTGLAYSAIVCFMLVGDISTTDNKGRQAAPMSGLWPIPTV